MLIGNIGHDIGHIYHHLLLAHINPKTFFPQPRGQGGGVQRLDLPIPIPNLCQNLFSQTGRAKGSVVLVPNSYPRSGQKLIFPNGWGGLGIGTVLADKSYPSLSPKTYFSERGRAWYLVLILAILFCCNILLIACHKIRNIRQLYSQTIKMFLFLDCVRGVIFMKSKFKLTTGDCLVVNWSACYWCKVWPAGYWLVAG